MEEQSYANHTKRVPLFLGLLGLGSLTFVGSVVNLFQSIGDHARLYNASLILAVTTFLAGLIFLVRTFPLKAQDRAIRAEENLRHFVLTGKLLDSRLSVKQIVALRFAPDEEFVELAARAAKESLPPDAIKQSVKKWRPDHYRL